MAARPRFIEQLAQQLRPLVTFLLPTVAAHARARRSSARGARDRMSALASRDEDRAQALMIFGPVGFDLAQWEPLDVDLHSAMREQSEEIDDRLLKLIGRRHRAGAVAEDLHAATAQNARRQT